MRILVITLILLGVVVYSATAQKWVGANPHVVVYKTRKDYRKLVPVILSDDKTTVVSYPDPADIKKINSATPVLLHKGFLLDRRGISKNTAFLNITYEAYAKLKKAPTPEALLRMIKDKDPIIKLYDCGNRYIYKDAAKEINMLIDNGKIGTRCTLI